jgi:hypothetical protein
MKSGRFGEFNFCRPYGHLAGTKEEVRTWAGGDAVRKTVERRIAVAL